MHRSSDPPQPAGGVVRQGRGARSRWREGRINLLSNKMGSETVGIPLTVKKGPNVAAFGRSIWTGPACPNSSEFIGLSLSGARQSREMIPVDGLGQAEIAAQGGSFVLRAEEPAALQLGNDHVDEFPQRSRQPGGHDVEAVG